MTDGFEQEVKIAQLDSPVGKRDVLYDAKRISSLDESLFAPARSTITDTGSDTIGRAQAVVHRYEAVQVVTKHYHRGGMIAEFLGDRYFGLRAENTRSFREWCMLSTMRKQRLPVPIPIAASRVSHGLFYRADLVTEFIADTRTLADACMHEPLEKAVWSRIGTVVRDFHDNNVYHADLNARNILIDDSGNISLIDFDKSRFRLLGESWRASNLARLKRSLDKFSRQQAGFNFTESNWQSLVTAYAQR